MTGAQQLWKKNRRGFEPLAKSVLYMGSHLGF